MEQWKVVPGTDNVYWASDLGRIKRVGKVGHTGRIMPEKILRLTPNGDGHLQCGINGRLWTVHKLVYLAWHGPIPEGKLIRHLDDVPAHNYPSNLAIGDASLNAADAKANGRGHGRRLSAADIQTIRDWLMTHPNPSYASIRELSSVVGCAAKTVRRYHSKMRECGLI